MLIDSEYIPILCHSRTVTNGVELIFHWLLGKYPQVRSESNDEGKSDATIYISPTVGSVFRAILGQFGKDGTRLGC